MDLAGIKQAVYDLGYESDSADRIVRLANAEQRRVIGDKRLDFMRASTTVAVVAGTATYTVPTTVPPVMHPISLRIADRCELEYRPPNELLAWANSAGYPYPWSYDAAWTLVTPTSILLYPAPNEAGTATLQYFAAATSMVDDSDEPVLPEPYQDIIVLGVAAKLAKRQRQFDTSSSYEADRDKLAGRMYSQYGIKQQQTSTQVAVSGDKWYGGDLGRDRL